MAATFDIDITARGEIGSGDRRYAEEKLQRIAKFAPRPILRARVTLTEESNPAIERRAAAEASLDVSGRVVRAHVAAAQMREAVDLLEARLRRLLEELGDLYETRRQQPGTATPGEGRRGQRSARPDFSDRPVDERKLMRHKTFAGGPENPESAALDMRLLDYDFFLFTNVATGEENVVFRRDDASLGWIQPTPAADSPEAYAIALHLDPAPAPALSVEEALARLDASGEPFVFFVNAATGRGHLVYRRYDGNYGLIAPADKGSVAA